MGILRTVIWIILTAILVTFSIANWAPVNITIWPGQVLETKLPVLIFIAFVLGILPMWIALRTARWSLNRRLDNSERQLTDLRSMANRASVPAPTASTPAPTIPPSPLEAS